VDVERGISEMLGSVPMVGHDHDLGVEREGIEGGAQRARQDEGSGIAAAAEALGAHHGSRTLPADA
jgi:hypothetical protein